MYEEIAAETFRQLMTILTHNRFGWIVEQVHETIDAGKPVERQVQPLAASSNDSIQPMILVDPTRTYRPSGGRPASFPAREEYSNHEQLALAIDAIQRALIDTVKMERFIYDRLIRGTGSITAIVFAEGNADVHYRIGDMDTAEVTHRSEQLNRLLAELRSIMEQTS